MSKKKSDTKQEFAFSRENYKLLIIALAIIIVGFFLMVGGKAESPDQFNPAIFSFRRITLAPIVVLGGFAFVVYAIMKKPKETDEKSAK